MANKKADEFNRGKKNIMFSYSTLLSAIFILQALSSVTSSASDSAMTQQQQQQQENVLPTIPKSGSKDVSPTAIHELFDSIVGSQKSLTPYRKNLVLLEDVSSSDDEDECSTVDFPFAEQKEEEQKQTPATKKPSVTLSDVNSSEDDSEYSYEEVEQKCSTDIDASGDKNDVTSTSQQSIDFDRIIAATAAAAIKLSASAGRVHTAKVDTGIKQEQPKEEQPKEEKEEQPKSSTHEKMISSIRSSNYENFLASLEESRKELEESYLTALDEYEMESQNRSYEKANTHYKILQKLLDFGVSANLADRWTGETTLIRAVRLNDKNLFRIIAPRCNLDHKIVNNGPPFSALFVAIQDNNFEMVEALLRQGASPYLPENLFTPVTGEHNVFHLVARTNSVQMATLLRSLISELYDFRTFERMISSSPSSHRNYFPLTMSLWYNKNKKETGQKLHDWFLANGARAI